MWYKVKLHLWSLVSAQQQKEICKEWSNSNLSHDVQWQTQHLMQWNAAKVSNLLTLQGWSLKDTSEGEIRRRWNKKHNLYRKGVKKSLKIK